MIQTVTEPLKEQGGAVKSTRQEMGMEMKRALLFQRQRHLNLFCPYIHSRGEGILGFEVAVALSL